MQAAVRGAVRGANPHKYAAMSDWYSTLDDKTRQIVWVNRTTGERSVNRPIQTAAVVVDAEEEAFRQRLAALSAGSG